MVLVGDRVIEIDAVVGALLEWCRKVSKIVCAGIVRR
jgi:hypothetical protein